MKNLSNNNSFKLLGLILFAVVCFMTFADECFSAESIKRVFGPNDVIPQEIKGLPESQRSETIHNESELFLWMEMLLKRCKQNYKNAVAEVNDLVANNEPVKRMSHWYIIKETDSYLMSVICIKKSEWMPATALKRFNYVDQISGENKSVREYQLNYKDRTVRSFLGSNNEGLVFFEEKLNGYYFKLNENRTCEVQFDENGKFQRAIVAKPRRAKEEKGLEYELHFSNENDLDIMKNKLLDRLIVASRAADKNEEEKNIDRKNKAIKTAEYEIDYDAAERVVRFHRELTGEVISFYSVGKVKSFSLPITADKRFTAEWDGQGKLVRNETITVNP